MTYEPHQASDAMIAHIAALVHDARRDWDVVVVKLVLGAHRTQCAGTDLFIAALRAAQNDQFLTPKAIGWRGPHWDGLATRPVEAESAVRCDTCGKTEPRCYSDRPGKDDDHVFRPNRLLVAR